MRLRRIIWLSLWLYGVETATLAAGPVLMSVQIKNGQLRSTPSFLGQVVTPLSYGDKVQVLETQNQWLKVISPGGQTGWVHDSALTKKRIVMNAGAQDVKTGASGDELALASKGFNSDVEAEFKAKNQNIDFKWVDKMEKIKISPTVMQEFLKEGGVNPLEGEMP